MVECTGFENRQARKGLGSSNLPLSAMGILLIGTLTQLVHWLSLHRDAAYGVLFLGAYFETLIGPCFFIPGEAVFLSGSILAGHGVLALKLVVPVLYAGALLGDSSSYLIGRVSKGSIFKEGRMILNPENYKKGHQVFLKYGPKAIFFARFLGPISWITPFLAGVYQVPYKTFIRYNIPGVILGVGQFILIGYFFGYKYEDVMWFVERYSVFVIVIALLIVTSRWYMKRRNEK